MAKMNVIWLGDADPDAQTIDEGGVTFVKGVPAKVPDDHPWLTKFRENPTFSVDEDASPEDAGEDEEIASVKSQLDVMGVKYRSNATLSSLRTLLAQNVDAGVHDTPPAEEVDASKAQDMTAGQVLDANNAAQGNP